MISDVFCDGISAGLRAGRAAARRVRALPAGAALFCLLCFCTRSARADIALDTLVGFGQNVSSGARYRPESWNPLTVYLTGQGVRGVGQLQVIVRQGDRETTYTRRVSLHEGPLNDTAGFVVLFQTPDPFGMRGASNAIDIHVQLLMDGRKLAEKKVSLPLGVPPDSYNLLALTRDGSGLNFLVKKELGLVHRHVNPANILARTGQQNTNLLTYETLHPYATSTVSYTLPTALPTMAQGYDMMDAVALSDLPLDSLSDDQIEAIKGYVRDGGLLIISGGNDVARLKSAFYTEMLPFEGPLHVTQATDLPDLAARYRQPLHLTAPIGLATGKLRPEAHALLGDLVIARPYGAGVVLFTAFDTLDPALRAWAGAPSLWRDLLRSGNESLSLRSTLSYNSHMVQSGGQALADALAGRQATSAPGFPIVAGFLVTYLILLVPVSYLVLKKIDKRELAWFTAPLLIVGFTIGSYVMALAIKGGTLTAHRAVVLETAANSDQVSGYAETTLYSPRRAVYDIGFGKPGDPNNPYRTTMPAELFTTGMQSIGGGFTIDQDATTTVRGAEIKLWDKRSFDTPVAADLGGKVEASVKMIDAQNVLVTVVNRTRYTLQDCTLIGGSPPISVGDLAPGQSISRQMRWASKGDSYGFSLPSGPTPPPDGHGATMDTAEITRMNLRNSMVQALTPQQDNNYYGVGVREATDYGRVPNALVGWFSDPLLPVQVDGKLANGEEMNLLMVHLPPPANAPAALQAAWDPFASDPVFDISDLQPRGAQGPGGLFR